MISVVYRYGALILPVASQGSFRAYLGRIKASLLLKALILWEILGTTLMDSL